MRRWAAGAVLVALVVTGACSGGGNTASSNTSSNSTSSSNKSESSSSSSGSGGATADFAACEEASKALEAAGNFSSLSSGGTLKDQAFAARDAMNSLADAVSDSDTKDALHTLANAYEEFGNKVGDTNYDPTSGNPPPAEVIAAVQVFANSDFAQAAAKLGQFFAGGCK